MRSQRRLRLYVIAVVAIFIVVVYLTTDAGGGIQNHKFYKSTVNAMEDARLAALQKSADAKEKSHIQKLDRGRAAGDHQDVLREGTHKDDAAPKDKSEETERVPVAGRTKMQAPKAKDEAASPAEKEGEPENNDEEDAKEELNLILKRSPIIIFSKSYCPFSKKAKSIILDHYTIVPAPYVVELDLHPLGPHIQQLLAKSTGRRTVPNVLVNGLSIGGGDDVEALDKEDQLATKIKSIGKKRIMEVTRKPETED